MSASFTDLPKDVIWKIFQFVIRDYTHGHIYKYNPCVIEVGSKFPNHFALNNVYGLRNLALINRITLKLVRSKTVRYKDGWLFIKGALLR